MEQYLGIWTEQGQFEFDERAEGKAGEGAVDVCLCVVSVHRCVLKRK